MNRVRRVLSCLVPWSLTTRRSIMKAFLRRLAALCVVAMLATPASAGSFFFSTGNPDGKIATLSRPASAGNLETETADDFVLSQPTQIDSATFTGLLPLGAPLTSVTQVEIEFYHVFPTDSTNWPEL